MRWPSHPVATILGVILLAAAGLKVHERLIDPTSGDATAGRGWLLLLLAECEVILGVWFLSGRAERLARRVAFGLFALFAAYNLYLVAAGQQSCGCLGVFKVNPAWMLLFDLSALAALTLWWRKPKETSASPLPAPVGWRVPAAGVLSLVVGAGVLAAALVVRRNGLGEGVTVVGDRTHQFGEVLANQHLTHTFELKNGLPEPVEIVRLKSNCGCTTADDLAGQSIAPGAVKEVPVSLRAGIDDDANIFGEVRVFLRRQGGGETDFLVLRVEATVRTDFEVSPATLDFGSVVVGQTATRTVTLSPRRMTDARVTSAELMADTFGVEPVRAKGQEVRVTFSPRPALRSGPVGDQLTIKTNSPNVPVVHVPVVARRVVPAEVTPMAVVVGPETRGAVTREVVVTALKEFDIREVTCEDARVTARQKVPGRGRSQTLVVTVAESSGSPVNAELRLTLKLNDDTASEEAYRVSVPVHRFQPRSGGL